MTITAAEDPRISAPSAVIAAMSRSGFLVAAQLPAISVTSGRSPLAWRFAHRYHAAQPACALAQKRATQPALTNGMTVQPSDCPRRRIVGIHICACESPITTSVLRARASASRQTRLDVFRSPAAHPSGKL